MLMNVGFAYNNKYDKLTNINHLSNCVFVNDSEFDINMRPSTARSAKGTPATVTTPFTRAGSSHTILGAIISAMGIMNIEIRLSDLELKRIKVGGSRKRKQPQHKKPASRATVTGATFTGHYNIQYYSCRT